MNKLIPAIFLLFVNPNHTLAADIYSGRMDSEINYVVVAGEITAADTQKFITATKDLSDGLVVLASGGGSVTSAIDIGTLISYKGFSTFVPEDTLCASACALIWLAGKNRFAEDASLIGFHAAYVFKEGIPYESGTGNALVGAYLNRLGLPDEAIIFVTNAPPEGITRLTKDLSDAVGISFISIEDISQNRSEKADYALSDKPYSPVEAVKSFYDALAKADGNLAASFVIPEKRGIGPFNEKNISNFFSNMVEPLKVISLKQTGGNNVQIHYRYRVTNTACDGTADIVTQYSLGNTLIKSIKANC